MSVIIIGRIVVTETQRTHCHRIAHGDIRDSFTDLRNRRGNFVTDGDRRLDALVHAAVVDVQVRAANATECDLQSDFTRTGFHHFALTDRERLITFVNC